MNKMGFTLVELLAVIVLIAIISMFTYPSIQKLIASNNEKQFTNYETLMVYYAKSLPLNKYLNASGSGQICLSTLKMKKINESITCNGFVKVTNNKFVPYLVCTQNGSQIWKSKVNNSTSWSVPGGCTAV